MADDEIPEAKYSQGDCDKDCPYLNRALGRCKLYHLPLRRSDSDMNVWAMVKYPFERCNDCCEKEG